MRHRYGDMAPQRHVHRNTHKERQTDRTINLIISSNVYTNVHTWRRKKAKERTNDLWERSNNPNFMAGAIGKWQRASILPEIRGCSLRLGRRC